jgi:hypothetical protein
MTKRKLSLPAHAERALSERPPPFPPTQNSTGNTLVKERRRGDSVLLWGVACAKQRRTSQGTAPMATRTSEFHRPPLRHLALRIHASITIDFI